MAMRFDGTDDSAQTANAEYGNTTLFSASFWFRIPTGATPNNYDYIWKLGNVTQSIMAYWYNNQIIAPVRISATGYQLLANAVSTNTWYNVIFTCDSANSPYHNNGYLNNVVGTQYDGLRDGYTSSQKMSIADNFNAGANMPCDLAEVAIWEGGSILTAQERSDLQTKAPPDARTANLVGYWPMVSDLNYVGWGTQAWTEDTGSGATSLGAGDHPPITLYNPSTILTNHELRIS